jgi:hypothetical protein
MERRKQAVMKAIDEDMIDKSDTQKSTEETLPNMEMVIEELEIRGGSPIISNKMQAIGKLKRQPSRKFLLWSAIDLPASSKFSGLLATPLAM